MHVIQKKHRIYRWFRRHLPHVVFLGLQKESALAIQNLSVLVSAGISVTEALQSVYLETRSWRLKGALHDIIKDIDNGFSLSTAFERTRIVNPYTYTLLSLGEQSGRLSENLIMAGEQNEKEALFRSRIRSALLYSVFVFSIAIVVGISVTWFVLPKIAIFFEDIDAPLPLITVVIMSAGSFLQEYGFVFVPLFVGMFGCLLYFLFSFPKTKFIGHRLLFHLPLIGRLIKETEVSRFGYVIGTMLQAGIPIREVFVLLPDTTTFNNYRVLYQRLSEDVTNGLSFKKSFASYKKLDRLLPVPVQQMIIAAEQSGTMADTFVRVGHIYETRIDTTSRNIPAFLEPILLLIIGGIVGVLALGILLPIYQLGLYI